jgi:hypothetical protein
MPSSIQLLMEIQLEATIFFTAAPIFKFPPVVFITTTEIRLVITPIPWALASIARAVSIHGGRNATEEVAVGEGETNLMRHSRKP